jgi:hypothetical protein
MKISPLLVRSSFEDPPEHCIGEMDGGVIDLTDAHKIYNARRLLELPENLSLGVYFFRLGGEWVSNSLAF